MDDWELSAEDLDRLERDALNQLARRNSAANAGVSTSSASSPPAIGRPPSSRSSAISHPSSSVSKYKENVLYPASKSATPDAMTVVDHSSKQPNPKLTVKLFLHSSGNIAAKFPFHQALVGAFRNIPRANWHANERSWMFPLSTLLTAERVLNDFGSIVELDNLDPLVRRAVVAASEVPDLQGALVFWIMMPKHLLCSFQYYSQTGMIKYPVISNQSFCLSSVTVLDLYCSMEGGSYLLMKWDLERLFSWEGG